MSPSITYREYCAWFLRTYGRPFAASEAEFLAALAAAAPTTPTSRYEQCDDLDKTYDSSRYLDGEEEEEGTYQ